MDTRTLLAAEKAMQDYVSYRNRIEEGKKKAKAEAERLAKGR